MKKPAAPLVIPRPKHRGGVLPTRVERDKTKALPRQAKHKRGDDPS